MCMLTADHVNSVCVASIVRAPTLKGVLSIDPTCTSHLTPTSSSWLLHMSDVWTHAGTAVDGGIWSTVEPLIGLLTANLPMMRPIYQKVIKSRVDSILSVIKTPKHSGGTGSSSFSKMSWAVKRSGGNSSTGGDGSGNYGTRGVRQQQQVKGSGPKSIAEIAMTTMTSRQTWPGFIPLADEPCVINTVGVGTPAHAGRDRAMGEHQETQHPDIEQALLPLNGGINVSRAMHWSEARRSTIV